MQRKFFLSLLVFLGATVSALAQISFSVSYKRVSPTEIDIVFSGKAASGWHIYGTNIEDGGPTRATFGTDQLKGVLKKAPVSRRSTMRFLICP